MFDKENFEIRMTKIRNGEAVPDIPLKFFYVSVSNFKH